MHEQPTVSPEARNRKHVAFLYAKTTEDTFCTIVTRRPHAASPHASEELHRIADHLPTEKCVSASSSGAASLHAILKGLEYVTANANALDIGVVHVFTDIRHLLSAWNNHDYWEASGTFLKRDGDVVKEEPSWRVILETHRKLPVNVVFGTANGRDQSAIMMRLAKDAAIRVRDTREVAA